MFRMPSFSFKPNGKRTSFHASSDIAPKVIGSCGSHASGLVSSWGKTCHAEADVPTFETKCHPRHAKPFALEVLQHFGRFFNLAERGDVACRIQGPWGMFMHVSTSLGCLPIFHRSHSTHRFGRLGTGRFMRSQASKTASRTFEKPEQPAPVAVCLVQILRPIRLLNQPTSLHHQEIL